MTSVLREPLVLPEDVLLTPVANMPETWRNKLGGEIGDFAISRPMVRETSKLIDASAAALLEHFRTARTIVHAVLAYSRERQLDAEQTLEGAFPLLRQLVVNGLLVPEASDAAKRILATLEPGSLFANYRLMRSVQVLDDTEVYQARAKDGATVALKVIRPGREGALAPRLAHEAAVLEHLDGVVNPALVESGEDAGRPFLALEWRLGVDAGTAAAQARSVGNRHELLGLLTNIARAYASLHRQGITHGDVHVGNVLVDRDGSVTLVDYGLAEFHSDDRSPVERGGVSFFHEPEWAEALLSGGRPPRATTVAEQYGLAALLYLLATGNYYAEFSLESNTMLRQISELPPLPFEAVGAEPWPELEVALGRALNKQPEDRYSDMNAFSDALASIVPTSAATATAQDGTSALLVTTTLEYLHPEGALFREGLPAGPKCSVNFGAAGVAYALYRLSCVRDDSDLLARADIWISKALRTQDCEDAFANPEIEMTPEVVSHVSPYHGGAGVQLVRALIARATGNLGELTAALTDFVTASRQQCAHRDLVLGRCGTVLGCALLLESQPEGAGGPVDLLRALGSERLAAIWDEVSPFGSLEGCEEWPNLCIAHGWAGLLYSTLRWHAVTGEDLPARFADRLAQITECTRPAGRGLSIPWREGVTDSDSTMPGWCNGTAGLVHLGGLAHRVLADGTQLALAEGAAWDAWDSDGGSVDLCCGLAGRAYALLDFHRLSGDRAWLVRAKTLAHRAARLAPDRRGREHPRHSLYKGELGLALLLAELDRPVTSCMPLFGEEA